MKKADGFTLIELLVCILCVSLVTGAAATFLLMGTRSNRVLLTAGSERQSVKIITTMVESLVSEGNVEAIYIGEDTREFLGAPYDSRDWDWAILPRSADNTPILLYSSEEKAIFASDLTVFMSGVTGSDISLSSAPLGGCLFLLSLETETSHYTVTSYCRTADLASCG